MDACGQVVIHAYQRRVFRSRAQGQEAQEAAPVVDFLWREAAQQLSRISSLLALHPRTSQHLERFICASAPAAGLCKVPATATCRAQLMDAQHAV